MITPPKIDAYVLEAFDHGRPAASGAPSLDAIATRVYGRKYEAQQAGDMLDNDTCHEFNLSDSKWRAELLDEDWGVPGQSGRGQIATWQALPVGPFGDISGVRAAPLPAIILADLIERGELPAGRYLLRVSW